VPSPRPSAVRGSHQSRPFRHSPFLRCQSPRHPPLDSLGRPCRTRPVPPPGPPSSHSLRLPGPRHILHPYYELGLFGPETRTYPLLPLTSSSSSSPLQKVTIDVCQVFGPDTVFLQQASHLTGGSYIHLERRDALLQYLIVRHTFPPPPPFLPVHVSQMAFLPPPTIRKVLAVPTQDKVDFRAACFCHKNIVDIGFVCSVCLSSRPIPFLSFHHSRPDLPSLLSTRSRMLHMQVTIHLLRGLETLTRVARTKFPIKTLQRLNQSRPPLPSTPGSASPKSSPGTPRTGSTNGANLARSISNPNELPHSSAIGLRISNGTSGRSHSMGGSVTNPGPNGSPR
jgi:transcription initiation factor TFIIH subunit 3